MQLLHDCALTFDWHFFLLYYKWTLGKGKEKHKSRQKKETVFCWSFLCGGLEEKVFEIKSLGAETKAADEQCKTDNISLNTQHISIKKLPVFPKLPPKNPSSHFVWIKLPLEVKKTKKTQNKTDIFCLSVQKTWEFNNTDVVQYELNSNFYNVNASRTCINLYLSQDSSPGNEEGALFTQ